MTEPEFVCPDCHARSWSAQDRIHSYCGRCHEFKAPKVADPEAKPADWLNKQMQRLSPEERLEVKELIRLDLLAMDADA